MNTQSFINDGQKFPLSTESLNFIQEQIKLVYGLTDLAGANVIIKDSTATKDGLVIMDGELLPLKGTHNAYISLVQSKETLSIGDFSENVRTLRVAVYGNRPDSSAIRNVPSSSFTGIKNILTLMDELKEAKKHHMPKGSIIDWYGAINPESLAYGYLPCGALRYSTLALAQAAKSKWEARYPGIVVTQWYEGGAYYYVKITNYQGTVIPDLTDRFIVQAGNSYSLGDIGGESKHRLSIDEIPAHRHVYNADSNGINRNTYAGMGKEESGNLGDYSASGSGAGGRAYSSYAGAGCGADGMGSNSSSLTTTSHENRPPYYALYKLIKVI